MLKDKMKYQKGYTLLFSIIVSSIVLSIAAFILSVSRKQFILSFIQPTAPFNVLFIIIEIQLFQLQILLILLIVTVKHLRQFIHKKVV
jgi:hypothetical protein